mgnify:CR=1 FL=1
MFRQIIEEESAIELEANLKYFKEFATTIKTTIAIEEFIIKETIMRLVANVEIKIEVKCYY